MRTLGLAIAAAALVVAVPGGSAAQRVPDRATPRSILSGGGPNPVGLPADAPYILAWSTSVTPAPGLLRTATEAGGIAVDPRTGWVFAATREGKLVCVAGAKTKWEIDLGGTPFAAPTVHRETVVVGTGEGVLLVVNKVTGAINARALLGEELITTPVVVETETATRAYVGSSNETLFAVELEYGQKLWRSHRDAPGGFVVDGFARPVVVGDTVYAGFADGWVQALDAATGSLRWERQLAAKGELADVDGLATDGKRLFATSYSTGVYALDLKTGAVLWMQPRQAASRLAVKGRQLFVVSTGELRSLQTSDGGEEWLFTFDAPRAAPTPVFTAGLVAFAQLDGPLLFLDRRSGTPRGAFGTGPGFTAPPAVVGNTLYALSNGGRVYAFGIVP